MTARSTPVLLGFGAISLALVYPLVRMQPTATASREPEGRIFDVRRLAEQRFASRTHRMVFIVEARDGDILRAAPLRELLENGQALRQDPQLGPRLLRFPSARTGKLVHGFTSLADVVDAQLRRGGVGGLAQATGTQVEQVVGQVLSIVPPSELGLSIKTRRDPTTGRWTSPAIILAVAADDEQLSDDAQSATLATTTIRKERFARQVLARLRGEQRHLEVWGLAVDVNLTSIEQGRAAGPFIGATIFAVLLLVGLLLRSYWAVAVVGLALGTLMLWLQGLANLVGLKQDQILATIVPIAMISFGVDYAFHAIGRYREFLRLGRLPAAALRLGLAGGIAALFLSLCTDLVAFLSNLTTSIESLQQFGVAAALGTISAFLSLGIFAPLLLSRVEQRVGCVPASRGKGRLFLEVGGGVAAALTMTAAVVLIVFTDALLGVALLGGYAVLFVALPTLISSRHPCTGEEAGAQPATHGQVPWLGRLVAGVAERRALVLPLALVMTAGAGVLASRVEAQFDVKDFFSPRTDFVVGLSKFDEHAGERSGEPALVYVEGALARPEAVRVLRDFREELRQVTTDALARNADGSLWLRAGLLEVVDAAGPAASAAHQLAAFRTALAHGIAPRGDGHRLTPDQVSTMLWISPDGERVATAFQLKIPGSRSNENIAAARAAVEPLVKVLETRLKRIDNNARAVFTGQPVARHAALDAIFGAFRHSLVVAVVLCFLLAASFMRSIRYAAVSIVPILLVVIWLYAFMYLVGYDVNVVTATIGAISVGVGIDFAVHFILRFREEIARCATHELALQAAGASTGGALLGAGVSSIVGFAILAFAPMPMFAAYGLLTAAMIALAFVATLVVLPALLMLVTSAPPPPGSEGDADEQS